MIRIRIGTGANMSLDFFFKTPSEFFPSSLQKIIARHSSYIVENLFERISDFDPKLLFIYHYRYFIIFLRFIQ